MLFALTSIILCASAAAVNISALLHHNIVLESQLNRSYFVAAREDRMLGFRYSGIDSRALHSVFTVVPSLSGLTGALSLRSIGGLYLMSRPLANATGAYTHLAPITSESNSTTNKSASFYPRLPTDNSTVSFESVAHPTYFLRHYSNFHLVLTPETSLSPAVSYVVHSNASLNNGATLSEALNGTFVSLEHARLTGFYAYTRSNPAELALFQAPPYVPLFRAVPGLCGTGISFKLFNGAYVRQQALQVLAHNDDGSTAFKQDATFMPVAALLNTNQTKRDCEVISMIALRSVAQPTHFLSFISNTLFKLSLVAPNVSPSGTADMLDFNWVVQMSSTSRWSQFNRHHSTADDSILKVSPLKVKFAIIDKLACSQFSFDGMAIKLLPQEIYLTKMKIK